MCGSGDDRGPHLAHHIAPGRFLAIDAAAATAFPEPDETACRLDERRLPRAPETFETLGTETGAEAFLHAPPFGPDLRGPDTESSAACRA